MKASSVPELKGGQMLTLLYIVGVILLIFVVVKILQRVGIIKTAAAKKLEVQKDVATSTLRTSDYFSPELLNKYPNYKKLGSVAEGYSKNLHKALTPLLTLGSGTDEELIFTTFGRMYSKLNIAETAYYYKKNYKSDLLTDLLNDLNESEQLTLVQIIDKLPSK